jgi:hypothetical protein
MKIEIFVVYLYLFFRSLFFVFFSFFGIQISDNFMINYSLLLSIIFIFILTMCINIHSTNLISFWSKFWLFPLNGIVLDRFPNHSLYED